MCKYQTYNRLFRATAVIAVLGLLSSVALADTIEERIREDQFGLPDSIPFIMSAFSILSVIFGIGAWVQKTKTQSEDIAEMKKDFKESRRETAEALNTFRASCESYRNTQAQTMQNAGESFRDSLAVVTDEVRKDFKESLERMWDKYESTEKRLQESRERIIRLEAEMLAKGEQK